MYDPLRNKLKVALVTIFSCLSGLGIASGIGWTNTPYSNSPMTSSEPQISQEAVQPALDLSDAFVNVAETVTPAVVRIEARKQVASRRNQNTNPFSMFVLWVCSRWNWRKSCSILFNFFGYPCI